MLFKLVDLGKKVISRLNLNFKHSITEDSIGQKRNFLVLRSQYRNFEKYFYMGISTINIFLLTQGNNYDNPRESFIEQVKTEF